MTKTTTKAIDFLDESMATLSSRSETYDSPNGERSMERAIKSFNIITGNELTEA